MNDFEAAASTPKSLDHTYGLSALPHIDNLIETDQQNLHGPGEDLTQESNSSEVLLDSREPDFPDLTLRESLWMHPSRVYFRSARAKLRNAAHQGGEVAHTAKQEYDESINKPRVAALTAATGVVQVVDRFRVVLALAPPKAIEIMKDTDMKWFSSPAAAAVVALYFAAWNGFMGKVTTHGLSKYPKAVKSFKDEFPVVVKAVDSALTKQGGTEIIESAANNETSEIKKSTIKDKTVDALKTGGIGIGFGSTPFIGIASVKGLELKQVNKINRKVTENTSAVLFLSVWPLAEIIRQAVNGGDFERAQKIQDFAANKLLWYGIAGVVAGLQVRSNRKERREVLAESVDIDDLDQSVSVSSVQNPTLAK